MHSHIPDDNGPAVATPVPSGWRRRFDPRQMGRRAFIWRYGVCFWGGMTAVLSSLLTWYCFEPQTPYLQILAGQIVVFPLAGYVWGMLMWRLIERQQQRVNRAV